MLPVLPYDIWALIASFLPKEILVKLYNVNSALFDISMNAIYHEIIFAHLENENARRCLSNLDIVVARRVRALTLYPHLYGGAVTLFTDIGTGGVSLREIAWNVRRWTNRSAKPPLAVVVKLLLLKIAYMSNLTSIAIRCPSQQWRMFEKAIVFVDAAWTHSSHLQSLTLDLPFEALGIILPSAPTFGSLEELHLTLLLAYTTSRYTDTMLELLYFINRHNSTLLSLSVDTPEPRVDPSSLFQCLESLPLLKTVSIGHPFERMTTNNSGIDTFLIKQSRTKCLQELKLRFYKPVNKDDPPSPNTFFSHPIFQISFPHLTLLDLGLCQWAKSLQPTVKFHLAQYLTGVRGSITRLILRDYVLSFPEVQSIVSTMGGKGSILRSLQLHTYFLSCDLFDLLASELPKLFHLELRFDTLISKDDDSWTPNYYWNGYAGQVAQFTRDMQDRHYPDWELRYLTVGPLYHSSKRWEEGRQILSGSIPSTIELDVLPGSDTSD